MEAISTSATSKIKEKYLENVLKDNSRKDPTKPNLRPIGDRKTFWEEVDLV